MSGITLRISSNFVYPDLVFGLPPDDQHLQVQLFIETKKQSPNTGARANNTILYTSN